MDFFGSVAKAKAGRLPSDQAAGRRFDPDSQLEPVAIGEDVILVFQFDRT